jgi:hypothetical protein
MDEMDGMDRREEGKIPKSHLYCLLLSMHPAKRLVLDVWVALPYHGHR